MMICISLSIKIRTIDGKIITIIKLLLILGRKGNKEREFSSIYNHFLEQGNRSERNIENGNIWLGFGGTHL